MQVSGSGTRVGQGAEVGNFSNFGSLKSTETTQRRKRLPSPALDFSNFGSLKSTETHDVLMFYSAMSEFQQFRLVEEH